MKKFIENKWYWVSLMLMSIVVYILNYNTTMWGDDYLYKMLPPTFTQYCDSLSTYFKSMPTFYLYVNGRIADMLLRFTTCFLGMAVFNVLNTLVFALLAHTLASMINTAYRVWVLVAVWCYFIILIPFPGETLTWMAGSFNYLWACAATMLFIKHLMRVDENGAPASKWHSGLLVLLSFVAGGMNESFTAAVVCSLVCYYALSPRKFKGVAAMMAVAYFAGFILILGSPGAWHRLNDGYVINTEMDPMQMVIMRLYNLATKSVHFITPALAIVFTGVWLYRSGIKKVSHDLRLWLLVGGMVSVFVFALQSARGYLHYSIIAFWLCATLIAGWIDSRRKLSLATLVLGIIASSAASVYAIKITHECKQYEDLIVQRIIESPDGVVLATTPPDRTRYYHQQFYDNRSTWRNQPMGFYYHKENVEFVSDSVYNRLRGTLTFTHGGDTLNWVSSVPAIATTIINLKDAGFAAALIHSKNTKDNRGDLSRVYYTDMEAYLGPEVARESKFWGTYADYITYCQYWLKHQGNTYMILPAINDSIYKIEVPIRVDGEVNTLTFTRP